MEADILESKKDLYLVQKYGGRYFEKVLFINLFYFVVSIGITACSIIMDLVLGFLLFSFCGAFVRYLLGCFYSLHA